MTKQYILKKLNIKNINRPKSCNKYYKSTLFAFVVNCGLIKWQPGTVVLIIIILIIIIIIIIIIQINPFAAFVNCGLVKWHPGMQAHSNSPLFIIINNQHCHNHHCHHHYCHHYCHCYHQLLS